MPLAALHSWSWIVYWILLLLIQSSTSFLNTHRFGWLHPPTRPNLIMLSYDDGFSHDDSSSDDRRRPKSIIDLDDVNDTEALMEIDEYCEVIDEFGCVAVENFYEKEQDGDYLWIRLEKDTDPTIKDISTREGVLEQINRVRTEQERAGRSDLYPRHWEPSLPDLMNGNRINGLARKSFTVMQFNALAEGLSAGPNDKCPFVTNQNNKKIELGNQNYGGFTDIPFPDVSLNFSKRRWRLLEVILNSTSDHDLVDIIALQEVDRFRGFFSPILKMFGYDGVFAPKVRSPCVRMGWYSDGCCLFWKRSSFELVSKQRHQYEVGNQVFLLAVLRHIASDRLILVAVTHLKAQQSTSNENIRCRQIEELMECVDEVARTTVEQHGIESIPAMILGDFNADPPAECQFSESAVQKVLHRDFTAGKHYKSAYEVNPPSESFFTTWKTRGSKTVRRIIDYIFYSDGVKCSHTLSIPTHNELERSKLPGLRYPSDHMMIAARFDFD